MSFSITDLDREALRLLCFYLEPPSVEQLAGFLGVDVEPLHERLKELERVGLNRLIERTARLPLPVVERPLFRWRPGEKQPAFYKLEYALRQRWINIAVQPCLLALATWNGAALVKGRAPKLAPIQSTTHMLALNLVWRWYSLNLPSVAQTWKREDFIPRKRGERDRPDALVKSGTKTIAIEQCGQYKAARLWRLHEHCRSRGYLYELW